MHPHLSAGVPHTLQKEKIRHHAINVTATNAYLCVCGPNKLCGSPCERKWHACGKVALDFDKMPPIASSATCLQTEADIHKERGQDQTARPLNKRYGHAPFCGCSAYTMNNLQTQQWCAWRQSRLEHPNHFVGCAGCEACKKVEGTYITPPKQQMTPHTHHWLGDIHMCKPVLCSE
jgi:hypothetical protein